MTNRKHFHVELMCCWCLNDLLKWCCANRNRKPWSTKMRVKASNCQELCLLQREQWKRQSGDTETSVYSLCLRKCAASQSRAAIFNHILASEGHVFMQNNVSPLWAWSTPPGAFTYCAWLDSSTVWVGTYSILFVKGICWHIADLKNKKSAENVFRIRSWRWDMSQVLAKISTHPILLCFVHLSLLISQSCFC